MSPHYLNKICDLIKNPHDHTDIQTHKSNKTISFQQWPTVQSLAIADLEDVMKTWSGLGYYSRGRRLHEGSKIVTENLNGRIPDTVPELMKLLPGIGRYSASAIASVAFQKVVGVVDGNVVRVLSRMRSIGAPSSQSAVWEHFW